MTTPIESVLCTAATPAQAKIYVAVLQAAGIPARIEGESLADEFAASQRLMGLLGSRVFVPTSSLERARELLQPNAVSPEDLTQQAMAAPPVEQPPTHSPAVPPSGGSLARWLAAAATVAALAFAWLWVDSVDAGTRRDPLYDYQAADGGWRELLRADGRLLRFLHDADGDGVYERIDQFDRAGRCSTIADQLRDGLYRRLRELRADGTTVTWTDDDGDGLFEHAEVHDAAGSLVQTLTQAPGGFAVK